MERRELDKQTPGQTDQPGETGSSRQRRQDGHIPAREDTRLQSPPSPRPGQGGTGCAARDESSGWSRCSLITVSMAIKGEKSNKSSSLQTQELSKSPGAGRQVRAQARDSLGLAQAHTHVPLATNTARLPCCVCSAPGSCGHREGTRRDTRPTTAHAPAHMGAHECVAQGHWGPGHAAPAPSQYGQGKPSFETFPAQQQGSALGSSASVLSPSPQPATLSISRIPWHLQGQQVALGELVAGTVFL